MNLHDGSARGFATEVLKGSGLRIAPRWPGRALQSSGKLSPFKPHLFTLDTRAVKPPPKQAETHCLPA